MILCRGNVGAHRVIHVVESQLEPYRVRCAAGKAGMPLAALEDLCVSHQAPKLLPPFEDLRIRHYTKNQLSCQIIIACRFTKQLLKDSAEMGKEELKKLAQDSRFIAGNLTTIVTDGVYAALSPPAA